MLAAAIIASYTAYLRSSYCVLVSRVLFLWDFLITMGYEVEYFWGRKITAASALFLLNRYVSLVITIMQFFSPAFFQTAHVCGPFVRVLQSLLVLSLVIAGAFAAIRVYAIWQRSWSLALPVFMLAMVPPALTIAIDANETPMLAPSPSSGCAIVVAIPPAQYTTYANAMRACTIAYDAIVFALTVLRTRQLERRSQAQTSLVRLIIRDGCLYFMCLVLINISQMVITFTSEDINYPSYFVSP
ncbi:hypothetical protein BDY19DRAFT_196924 [Irpex rosettiformis]|uniref:Uncharacterized protein n=1 Tax=Irpex rosettiformis TaxID=378272 RepID=A0ACB8U2A1_9APHY|nr:hypothetical protein BDY19DRAFT_196924 [Irpex rosettiformis]